MLIDIYYLITLRVLPFNEKRKACRGYSAMLCKLYFDGNSFELDMKEVLEYWYSDPATLLELIRTKAPQIRHNIFSKGCGSNIPKLIISRIKHGEYYVFGFRTESLSPNKHSLFVVCASNPDSVYSTMIVSLKDSEWRDYGTYRYYKGVLLDNYLNSYGLSELNEAFHEVVEFQKDIIRCFLRCDDKNITIDTLTKSAYLFALYYIAFPTTYAILGNLLLGYMPACFMLLRLIVESLVKGLIVDQKYKFKNINIVAIENWENYIKKSRRKSKKIGKEEKLSMSGILKNWVKELVGSTEAKIVENIWGKLSERYVHFRGYAERVGERALGLKNSADVLPLDMVVVPIQLDDSMVLELQELRDSVNEVRKLLQALRVAWIRFAENMTLELLSA